MSGGVDSSISLILLKKQGWQPIGVSLKYSVWNDKKNLLRENVCCSEESFDVARSICKKLKVPHHVFDVSGEFKKEVIDYFISELKKGRTPNPCIVCNRCLKFRKLFEWAQRHGIKKVSTGHYAQAKRNAKTGRYELLQCRDEEKDQTYSLCLLTEKQLSNIIFPLGIYTKKEVYKMAEKENLGFFLRTKQSQDFCFVARKCLNCFLEKEIGKSTGFIRDSFGNVLGKHSGLHFYTIGQRKGLNLPGGPYFVKHFDTVKNDITVTKHQEELLQTTVFLSSLHFINKMPAGRKIRVMAKIRYRQQLDKAYLFQASDNKAKLVFEKPQRAITPGQFAVFYQGNVCLGGGKIIRRHT